MSTVLGTFKLQFHNHKLSPVQIMEMLAGTYRLHNKQQVFQKLEDHVWEVRQPQANIRVETDIGSLVPTFMRLFSK